MRFPLEWNIGALTVSAHFIRESLAYTIAFACYNRARRQTRDFLPAEDRWSIVAAAIVGAALGSRVLNWFEDPAALLVHWADPVWLMSGKTIVGGLLGGTVAVEWVKRTLGIARRTGDLFDLPLVIGIAVGRIGCFFAGLPDNTYGVATALPWGVDFGDGIRRHPTQLYEIAFLICLGMFIRWIARHPHREGDLFRTFLIAYLAFRLAIDSIKPGTTVVGLTVIQWACLAAILAWWRDIPYLISRGSNAESWATASVPISSTTPPSPSARNVTGDVTQR